MPKIGLIVSPSLADDTENRSVAAEHDQQICLASQIGDRHIEKSRRQARPSSARSRPATCFSNSSQRSGRVGLPRLCRCARSGRSFLDAYEELLVAVRAGDAGWHDADHLMCLSCDEVDDLSAALFHAAPDPHDSAARDILRLEFELGLDQGEDHSVGVTNSKAFGKIKVNEMNETSITQRSIGSGISARER